MTEVDFVINGDTLHLQGLYTPKQYRHKGYAKKAMLDLIKDAKKRNLKRIKLTVYDYDKSKSALNLNELIEFYKSFGFTLGSNGSKPIMILELNKG